MPIDMTREYPLRMSDFDRRSRLKPSSILDLFQEIATVQATSMGIGSDEMARQGVFWVVVRTKYEMVAQPLMHGTVLARTWPYTSSKFAFQRDYQLKTPDGAVLVKATSEWVLVSKETRSFEPLAGHYDDSVAWCTDRNFPKKARRIHDFDEEGLPAMRVVPGESAVDLNGHINNARYADFVTDAVAVLLPSFAEKSIRTFQIDYRHEVLAGEPLQMYAVEVVPGTVRAKGVNGEGAVAFSAELAFEGGES